MLEQKPRGVARRVLVERDDLGVFEQIEALWVLLLDHRRDGRYDHVRGLVGGQRRGWLQAPKKEQAAKFENGDALLN